VVRRDGVGTSAGTRSMENVHFRRVREVCRASGEGPLIGPEAPLGPSKMDHR